MRRIRFALFRRLTASAPALFMRGQDHLSVTTHVTGRHEPALTELICHCTRYGYNDFLIDIGANIGLVACQSGHLFAETHLFEPNPLCIPVLDINTRITPGLRGCTIHPDLFSLR